MDAFDDSILKDWVIHRLECIPKEQWGRELAHMLALVVQAYTELYFSSVGVSDVGRSESPSN